MAFLWYLEPIDDATALADTKSPLVVNYNLNWFFGMPLAEGLFEFAFDLFSCTKFWTELEP